jgi:glutamate transport system substrate-binding protein
MTTGTMMINLFFSFCCFVLVQLGVNTFAITAAVGAIRLSSGLLVLLGGYLWWDDGDDEFAKARRLTNARGLAVVGLASSISLDELAIGLVLGTDLTAPHSHPGCCFHPPRGGSTHDYRGSPLRRAQKSVRWGTLWAIVMDLEPRQPWTDPSPSPKPSSDNRSRSVLHVLRRRGWLRPRRIGCLLVVLVIAALWVLGRAVEGITTLFGDHPAPVVGSPFDAVAPPRPATSGSPTIDRIAQRGKLIVAVQETPGLAQRSPGSSDYTGFDIALLDLIARDLGVDPAAISFKPLAAGSREAALGRGEADLVLGGYEITPQRRAQVKIAGPYLVRLLQLAVPANSPVTDLNSLGQGTVCAPADSPAAAALAARGERFQTRTTLAACANLLGNRVEAIASDQAAVAAVLAEVPGTLRVLDEPLGITEYGIGLPAGDQVLHERVAAVLRRAIDDGTWARRYAEYLGTPVPSPPLPR